MQAAFAQDAPQTIQKVQVTGSRLLSPNADSATPLQILTSADIAASGATNLQELLQKNPTMGTPTLSRTNSNFLTSGGGVTTINLRNLGDERTLVLVNGRRFVSGVPGSSAVDMNTIPTDFIERVELLTGGASATYGSDAVAGVVNIILKRNLNGVLVDAQTGRSSHGDDFKEKTLADLRHQQRRRRQQRHGPPGLLQAGRGVLARPRRLGRRPVHLDRQGRRLRRLRAHPSVLLGLHPGRHLLPRHRQVHLRRRRQHHPGRHQRRQRPGYRLQPLGLPRHRRADRALPDRHHRQPHLQRQGQRLLRGQFRLDQDAHRHRTLPARLGRHLQGQRRHGAGRSADRRQDHAQSAGAAIPVRPPRTQQGGQQSAPLQLHPPHGRGGRPHQRRRARHLPPRHRFERHGQGLELRRLPRLRQDQGVAELDRPGQRAELPQRPRGGGRRQRHQQQQRPQRTDLLRRQRARPGLRSGQHLRRRRDQPGGAEVHHRAVLAGHRRHAEDRRRLGQRRALRTACRQDRPRRRLRMARGDLEQRGRPADPGRPERRQRDSADRG
ncbi:TonB-dependent receptor plug domain-containing protein [Rugamonas sp. DEMB1]|uniref:TonB-dependent receptor plug domain-containing protein n=1 Tax=Rugamonas sp. DEMB1 TaxID=3039386 RepID=UPI00244A5E10|nr:TonB-dependent receptor plug domain-containing protein [Rugamonas sp. DEMB1]WGG53584.1 TonB-dependent receptor plug domain-containing protein [Rugamonas sp. DEMB1]